MRHATRTITATTVAAVVLALVFGAPVAPRAGAAPVPIAPVPTAPASISWHTCADGFQCATLTVPVDPAADTGATLGLAVIRKRARHPKERIGSLVFNPGGPGVPAVGYLAAVAGTLPDKIRDRFDLVAFDPRGIGTNSPVECEDSLDPLFDQSFQPTTAAERALGLVDAVRTLAGACAARSGALLSHVSTLDAVRDLERLRVGLGEDRLSFVGFSYGTFLGASYASAYPHRVRAFVLDGPIDPTMTADAVTLGQARGFEHSLDDFLADCSAHPGCAFHHDGDAAGAYDALRRARLGHRSRPPASPGVASTRPGSMPPFCRSSTSGARRGRRWRPRSRRPTAETRRPCSMPPMRSSVATQPAATIMRSRRSGR